MEGHLWWQGQDPRTLKRINRLIRDIERHGLQTTGKPEPLHGDLSGWWSARVDDANRLVFAIRHDTLEIYARKGHYE